MRELLSLTRVLAAKHGKRHVPRSLRGLSTPSVRRTWGNMKDLTAQEKDELLHGEWRATQPIALVADKADRDHGGFTAPVTFASDEDADSFLAEEDAENAEELRESTLMLARRFFVELAAAADEEVDASQMPPPPRSDEARRKEMRDVQRHFFADYYTEQGVITEVERYAFVDALLRPSCALFLVNATLPLVRLTVRDQLESHQHTGAECSSQEQALSLSSSSSLSVGAQPVFAATDLDPCLYAVPLVPTQSIGAPLHVPYTAATSLVGAPGSVAAESLPLETPAAAAIEGGQRVEAIDTADMLSAMLQDDDDVVVDSAAPPASTDIHDASLPLSSTAHTSAATVVVEDPPAVSYRPPSLAHTYWLQRQVASNALLNVDLLSHAISLLSVRLAAAAGTAQSRCEVILYHADTTVDVKTRLAASSTYHGEVAHYLYRATQDAAAGGSDGEGEGKRLRRIVLAVEDATFHPPRRPASRQQNTTAPLPGTFPHESSDVPVVDRYPNTLYVAPSTTQQQQRHIHKMADARSPLRGRVVICAPTTSQDGVRPRGWLAGADPAEEEEDGDTAASLSSSSSYSASRLYTVASPNNFVERCQAANVNFTRLQRCLYRAIHAVDVGEGCESPTGDSQHSECTANMGFVVYATQSMNVIENEAVVCAVLQRLASEQETLQLTTTTATATDTRTVPVRLTCVPVPLAEIEERLSASKGSAAAEGIRLLRQRGRCGFSTWVAVEGGEAAQEPQRYTQELRAAVAEASWCTDPLREGSDGGYVVCLRVSPATAADAAGGVGLGVDDLARRSPMVSTPGRTAMSEQTGLCWWTHPRSHATAAVTPALLHLLSQVFPAAAPTPVGARTTRPHRCTVLHAGVPVGYAPAALASAVPSSGKVVLGDLCALSSATSHVDVLAALKKELPVLQLSALAVSELLSLKSIGSRELGGMLRRLHKQLPTAHLSGAMHHDDLLEAETVAFLAAVERLVREREASTTTTAALSQRRFSVVVEVAPDSFVPQTALQRIESAATTAVAGGVLHPAVAAEVRAAGVVAEVTYTQLPTTRVSHKSPSGDVVGAAVAASGAALYDFTVQVHIPLDMPERAKHLAALEEWRVAFRDALLYVHRRTTGATAPRLWERKTSGFTPAASSGVRLPRGDEEGLELAEDEYEAAADMPQRFHGRGMQTDAGVRDLFAIASLSKAPGRSEDGAENWLEDTNYREWRRRRSQR